MYTVKKHRKTTKPMMSQMVCNMVSNQGSSIDHIKLVTGATSRQVIGTINLFKPKRRVTDQERVNILGRALLSRPMSKWGDAQLMHQNL